MTVYSILKKNEEGWDLIGSARSRSAKAAVSTIAAELGDGEYVAVPARSWKMVTVKVETKTAFRFS